MDPNSIYHQRVHNYMQSGGYTHQQAQRMATQDAHKDAAAAQYAKEQRERVERSRQMTTKQRQQQQQRQHHQQQQQE